MKRHIALGAGAVLAMAAAQGLRADEIGEDMFASPRGPHPQDPDIKTWADKIATLTEAQAHIFRSLRMSGITREVAFAQAATMDPEITIEGLQQVAKRNLMQRSPAYAKAEAKRARKAEKLRQITERAG